MLINMGGNCTNWKKLSEKFNNKSPKICKRRYFRLLRNQ